MTRIAATALLTALLAACATTSPEPLPSVVSRGERLLVLPTLGYNGTIAPQSARRFDAAWLQLISGNDAAAEQQLTDLIRRHPSMLPARVALAALEMLAGDFDSAVRRLDEVLLEQPAYFAAELYLAEIAWARGEMRRAWEAYRALASRTAAPPEVGQRAESIRQQLFEQTFREAQRVSDAARSITLLREALSIEPAADAARLLLVQWLISTGSYDEARRELNPLLTTGKTEELDIQRALADIDAGKGRYESAIQRYERLVRAYPDAGLNARLAEIKRQWSEANLPLHYRRAVESSALTRADLAVLIYWNVPAVRFAQNVWDPPIAIDIGQVIGREELVRAMALRILPVDRETRRVDPYRVVTEPALLRYAARVLLLRGTPACGAEATAEPNETLRAQRLLVACGVTRAAALRTAGDAAVTGRTAADLFADVGASMERR